MIDLPVAVLLTIGKVLLSRLNRASWIGTGFRLAFVP